MVNEKYRVRPAVHADYRQIADLIHFESHLHRHLDWRNPLDWIGTPPYMVLESGEKIVAVLGCPPDPPQVAWVRLFVSSSALPVTQAWQTLWEAVHPELSRRGSSVAALIVLHAWLQDLVQASGFTYRQHIVMLERESQLVPAAALPPEIRIRPLAHYDLPAVAEVDAAAFEPLWQNSLSALGYAFPQAAWADVAESEQGILGYQLSTRNAFGGHLARLAVSPQAQSRGVGYALIAHLVQQMSDQGLTRLTVNTQSDNSVSLALYQKIGFRETGDRYPVFIHPL